jgi:two-component sensor histidine kinase
MDRTFTPKTKPLPYPRFGILFVVWTLLGMLGYARYFLEAGPSQPSFLLDLLVWLGCYYPWLCFTPLVFRLERRFALSRTTWPKHLACLALAGLPLSYLAYAAAIAFAAIVRYVFHETPSGTNVWWPMPLLEVALEQALFWFTVGGVCVVRNLTELREKERQAAQLALKKSELEGSLRQAELENLRMRLNPHFLFNCLQNISALSQQDSSTASKMLTRLGDLLRTALQRQAETEATLETELTLTQTYISLEKMRFGDRLSVLIDIAPGTEHALVPSLLLQPLVENAVRHGMRGQRDLGLIWIRSARQSDELLLTISDNGAGISTEKLDQLEMGIGLGSTLERLERLYSDQHRFSIRRLPEGGTEARIALPLRFKEAATETPRHEQASSPDRR